jgi:hypothetical protein
MRRHLGSLLPALTLVAALAASLAACGDDDSGSVAKDPATTASTASQQTESPTDPSEEPFGYRLVDMITVTAAGGQPSAEASALGDDASVRRFVAQFTNDGLARQVRDSVARTEVPEGQTLYGAVVALGCDSPTDVEVDVTAGGVAITAQPVPSPLPECLAPMTTVALVLVDA